MLGYLRALGTGAYLLHQGASSLLDRQAEQAVEAVREELVGRFSAELKAQTHETLLAAAASGLVKIAVLSLVMIAHRYAVFGDQALFWILVFLTLAFVAVDTVRFWPKARAALVYLRASRFRVLAAVKLAIKDQVYAQIKARVEERAGGLLSKAVHAVALRDRQQFTASLTDRIYKRYESELLLKMMEHIGAEIGRIALIFTTYLVFSLAFIGPLLAR
ncbi:MAG: hypothetical protein MRY63_11700 [Neomegalonema sp.]|nr:hypothetical protein [Neomegalonema sp.]